MTGVTILHHKPYSAKMHSMDKRCTSRRELKRHQTAMRLQQCALDLTVQHGFDGWTIEDLAEAADVSRRTVFNYFEGKAEVVLGPEPDLDDVCLDTFVEGGPTGHLFDDLLVLAREATREKADSEQYLAAVRTAIMNDPHLHRLVHERFEVAATLLGDCLQQREGDDFPLAKARTLLRMLMVFFDDALERLAADDSRTFHEHLDACVADTRVLLA